MKGLDKKPIRISQLEYPFSLDTFEYYFIKIYHTLYQVVGVDVKLRITIYLIYMADDVQDPMVISEFDCTIYLVEKMHKHMVAIKVNENKFDFRWYSLQCYIFLYVGVGLWHKILQVR